MFRRRYRSEYSRKRRSFFGGLAHLLRIPLVLVLVVLGMLAFLETPWVADLLAGVRPSSPLVGLVAGHWQNDSGAVCADGLQEVDVNLEIARKTADLLRRQGYRVEILPEFSAKLNGYRAAALLAIHNDSCVQQLSGFKIARMTHSSDPEVEDRLVELLYGSYGEATGIKAHPNTITEDMRQYHALRRIAPQTPGAIIECGFLGGDRRLLTDEPDRVAEGISNGLVAFLAERSASATPKP